MDLALCHSHIQIEKDPAQKIPEHSTMQTYGVAFRFRFVLTELTRTVKPFN